MSATHDPTVPTHDRTGSDRTLVWIDARQAVIARWHAGEVRLERLRSDVPPHRRTTRHVRYDPAVAHGGGAPEDVGEAKRLEHLARFVDLVAARVPVDVDLVIVGPGTVRERLEHHVRETDRHASRTREVSCEPAPRSTERQLIARLRDSAGAGAPRRTTGAYRRTDITPRRASGAPSPRPRHPERKPPLDVTAHDLIEEEVG